MTSSLAVVRSYLSMRQTKKELDSILTHETERQEKETKSQGGTGKTDKDIERQRRQKAQVVKYTQLSVI